MSEPLKLERVAGGTEQFRRLLAAGSEEEARLLLVDLTRDPVYRFLRQMLRDDPGVDDLFQDTYVRAFRAMTTFRGDSSLVTWMLTIARNTALNRIRRRKLEQTWQTTPEVLPETIDESAPSPRDEADRAASDRRLLGALDGLSPAQREAVLLFYLEDRPVDEVSRITGRPANTIKSDLRRARLLLRGALEGKESGR